MSKQDSTVHVVVVEPELLMRHALHDMIAASPDTAVSATAASIEAAEQLPPDTRADLVLVAMDIPQMRGTSGITRLLKRFPSARVVVLGARAEAPSIIAAFRAGAAGYLTWDTTPIGLVRALRGVANGEVALPRALTSVLVDAIRDIPQMPANESLVRLSAREQDVLIELVQGHSNAQIGYRLGVSESTIKTHVSNILRKTGHRSRFLLRPTGNVNASI